MISADARAEPHGSPSRPPFGDGNAQLASGRLDFLALRLFASTDRFFRIWDRLANTAARLAKTKIVSPQFRSAIVVPSRYLLLLGSLTGTGKLLKVLVI